MSEKKTVSLAKSESARLNGKLGGRPPKVWGKTRMQHIEALCGYKLEGQSLRLDAAAMKTIAKAIIVDSDVKAAIWVKEQEIGTPKSTIELVPMIDSDFVMSWCGAVYNVLKRHNLEELYLECEAEFTELSDPATRPILEA